MVGTSIFAAKTLAGSSIQEAVGWALVPEIVNIVQMLLQGRAAKINVSENGLWLRLAVNLFVAHAGVTGADHVDTTLKVFNAYRAFNAVAMVAAPEKGLKAWGLSSCSGTDPIFMRSLGWMMGCYATALFSQLQGNSAATAVGHTYLVLAASGLSNVFITKGTEKLGGKLGPMYAWYGIACAVAAFTLF